MIIKGRSPTMRPVSRNHRVALDWLFDRINLDPKMQIKYIDTRNQLADILTKGNFTRDEWNHLFVQHQAFQFHQLSWSDVQKNTRRCRWRKSHSKIKADDEVDLATQRKGSERACYDCIGKPGEYKSESQKVPMCSLNEQQPGTKIPVMGASSSDYSEWNIDDKWSSQEWKSGEMLEARTVRPVGGQESTQDIDKSVIDDDDMDSDTVTESNLSLKSRSFLNRVNDRLRKILDHSSKDAMQDIDKRSIIWWMWCLQHWKHLYSWWRITQKFHFPSKTQRKISL